MSNHLCHSLHFFKVWVLKLFLNYEIHMYVIM